jgi:hypothetical protein
MHPSRAILLVNRVSLALVCVAFATEPTNAQRTWHVPGDFTEIQPAFDAAAPGDTIIVARHFANLLYPPATTSKGLTLLSTSSWGGIGGVHVTDLPAGETFVMASFQGAFPFHATRCAGRVHVDNWRHLSPIGYCGPGNRVFVP